MIRRWLIRCLCLLPLTLCALGWVWSESHGADARYFYQDTHCLYCGTSFGRIWLRWEWADFLRSNPGGLSYRSWSLDSRHDDLNYGEMAWLGFRFWHCDDPSNKWRTVDVPYWFLLLLSAPLLIPAWRTTRPRPGGQGFPVELASARRPAASPTTDQRTTDPPLTNDH